MTYEKQTWVDGEAGETPINAARLGHMEDGILAASAVTDGSYVTAFTNAASPITVLAAGNDPISSLLDGDAVQGDPSAELNWNSGTKQVEVLVPGWYRITATLECTGAALGKTGQFQVTAAAPEFGWGIRNRFPFLGVGEAMVITIIDTIYFPGDTTQTIEIGNFRNRSTTSVDVTYIDLLVAKVY